MFSSKLLELINRSNGGGVFGYSECYDKEINEELKDFRNKEEMRQMVLLRLRLNNNCINSRYELRKEIKSYCGLEQHWAKFVRCPEAFDVIKRGSSFYCQRIKNGKVKWEEFIGLVILASYSIENMRELVEKYMKKRKKK
jgi:hypothetical protein